MTDAGRRESDAKRSTRFKVLWTVWMSGGGIATAAIVYMLTASLGWAIAGLLASGVVLNAIAQIVIQPIKAVSGNPHRPPGGAQRPGPRTREPD
jgi:hypothetical protein